MPKSLVQHTTIEVDGRQVPVKVHLERRRSIRFYLGKKGGILRLPSSMPEAQRQQEWQRFRKWMQQKLADKGPESALGRTYQHGDLLTVGQRQYKIEIEDTANKTHAARLAGPGIIRLRLSANANEVQRTKAVQHLLSRVVAQDFMPEIERRVYELNHLYFRKRVNSVNLKYNRSNWGSCSSKANINLSTCLLFAPNDVIDYVIIHELAHLIEMNHSDRFWALVEQAMPDYKEKKKWLRENWQRCLF